MASLFGQNIDFLDAAYRPAPAPDQSGTQSFFKGWQMRQEQQKLAMEQQRQDAMLPAQTKLAQLQVQSAALDIAGKTRMADYALQAKAGETELADSLGRTNWENPIDRAHLYSIAARNPAVMDTKAWAEVQKNIENSDKASAGRAEALAASRLFGATQPSVGAMTASPEASGTGGTSITPESLSSALQTPGLEGKGVENVLTTAARYQEYQSRTKMDQGTVSQQDLAAASRLRQKAEALRQSGDATGYQDALRQAEILETHVAPKGITVQSGVDSQGNPQTTTTIGGGAPEKLTTRTQSNAQQQAINGEVAMAGITDILYRITSADVGVKGVIGEQAFDKWLAQINPDMASQQRIENRTALRVLREHLFAAMSAERTSGTGFSNKDAERIKDLASGLDASTSYPDLVARLGEIKKRIATRTAVYAERTGQPIPDFAKSPYELQQTYESVKTAIQQEVKENRLTPAQGQSELNAIHQRTVDALRRFHGIEVNKPSP